MSVAGRRPEAPSGGGQQLDVASAGQRDDCSIEREQPGLVAARDREQVRIGHLAVPVDHRHVVVAQRHVVCEEPMAVGRTRSLWPQTTDA
jgi:hypothetical protein